MRKKVIFIFATAYLPFVGGAEVAVKEITDRILEYDFILFTAKIKRGLPKKEKIGNVLVYRLGFGFSFDKVLLPFLAFIKFLKLISSFKFQVSSFMIWSIMSSYGGIAVYLIKLFKPNTPFLLTLQEGDSEEHLKHGKLGLIGFFGKRIIRKADYIQAISHYLKDFAIKQGARSPIIVVPNGVDIKKIQNANLKSQNDCVRLCLAKSWRAGNAKLKNELNLKPEEKIIITTSRLVYKNGVDILIKAMHLLNAKLKIKNLKLLIAGEGPLKKDLEKLTTDIGLKEKVIFLGLVLPEQVYDYLAISDIFVRPSRSEGLGNSFLEAMACGVPVIGTNVGGIPDFLTHGETGLFCEVDNPHDLTEKTKLLLEDSILREKITANAKKLVHENYDWDKISKRMKGIFNNLVYVQATEHNSQFTSCNFD